MAADPFMELLDRPKRSRTVTLAWDPDQAEDLTIAHKLVKRLERQADRDNAPETAHLELAEARRRLEEVEGSMDTVTFHFESIGTRAVDKLLEMNPPSKEDQDRHRATGQKGVLQFDPNSYPAALIAATCTKIVTPSGEEIAGEDVTPERVMALFESNFSQTDQVVLFNSATLVDLSASTIEDVLKG